MSYILDALRRADAERERGAVPGLNAQPVLRVPADAAAPPPVKPWVWVAAGCSVPLIGVLVWQMLGRNDATRATAEPAPVVASAAPAPAPSVPPPLVATVPPAPALAARPAAVVAQVPTAAPPARPVAAPVVRKTVAAPVKPATRPEPAASTSAAQPRIVAQSELPDDVRRQLPPLTVGGSVYANRASNRVLILNGQAFREGDTLAAGLVLEQIQLKSAVLRFKTYRFTISY